MNPLSCFSAEEGKEISRGGSGEEVTPLEERKEGAGEREVQLRVGHLIRQPAGDGVLSSGKSAWLRSCARATEAAPREAHARHTRCKKLPKSLMHSTKVEAHARHTMQKRQKIADALDQGLSYKVEVMLCCRPLHGDSREKNLEESNWRDKEGQVGRRIFPVAILTKR